MTQPAQTDPVVEVRGLHKVFRDFWHRPKVRALDGITFDIGPGEVFGLLGPNGSGKSTTIKILLGLLHPSEGSVQVLGCPPTSVSAKQDIGYLPEESYLYRYLTPRETLRFYGRLFDLPTPVLDTRTREMLDMVGPPHAANRPVGEFSKVMSRRIGIAQALINDPRLVILDEPTSGLDPIGCRQIKDLIQALAKRGKTVLLSSHLLADVEDVCDRIAILYNGRIQAHGRVRELLEQPDRMRFTIPALPPDRLQAMLQQLREIVGAEPAMERPALDLETYFLKVVETAHQTAGLPSGAVQSKTLAGYLKPDA